MKDTKPPRVAFRCDSSTEIGTGHVTRCYALAQELLKRGVAVDFVGSMGDVPILKNLSEKIGIRAEADAEWADYSVVVLDSYRLEPDYSLGIKSFGPKIAVIADGTTPALLGDLYIEPNPNLLWNPPPGSEHANRMMGPKFALIRSEILQIRAAKADRPIGREVKVLVLLGGMGLSLHQLPLLAALDSLHAPLRVTIVSGLIELDKAIFNHIEIDTSAPRPDLEILLKSVDLVISAAGVTSWEVLTTGKP